jgi:hypothetical protein
MSVIALRYVYLAAFSRHIESCSMVSTPYLGHHAMVCHYSNIRTQDLNPGPEVRSTQHISYQDTFDHD